MNPPNIGLCVGAVAFALCVGMHSGQVWNDMQRAEHVYPTVETTVSGHIGPPCCDNSITTLEVHAPTRAEVFEAVRKCAEEDKVHADYDEQFASTRDSRIEEDRQWGCNNVRTMKADPLSFRYTG